MTRTTPVLVAVVLVLTASCSAVSDDGPLQLGSAGDSSRACGPLPKYTTAAFGVNLPTNLPEGIVIDKVDLVEPHDITVDSSYLMPVGDGYRLLLDNFPPTEQFPDAWPKAVDAIGATVATDTTVDLVIEVSTPATAEQASFDAVLVEYSVDGRSYRTQNSSGLLLSLGGDCHF